DEADVPALLIRPDDGALEGSTPHDRAPDPGEHRPARGTVLAVGAPPAPVLRGVLVALGIGRGVPEPQEVEHVDRLVPRQVREGRERLAARVDVTGSHGALLRPRRAPEGGAARGRGRPPTAPPGRGSRPPSSGRRSGCRT